MHDLDKISKTEIGALNIELFKRHGAELRDLYNEDMILAIRDIFPNIKDSILALKYLRKLMSEDEYNIDKFRRFWASASRYPHYEEFIQELREREYEFRKREFDNRKKSIIELIDAEILAIEKTNFDETPGSPVKPAPKNSRYSKLGEFDYESGNFVWKLTQACLAAAFIDYCEKNNLKIITNERLSSELLASKFAYPGKKLNWRSMKTALNKYKKPMETPKFVEFDKVKHLAFELFKKLFSANDLNKI